MTAHPTPATVDLLPCPFCGGSAGRYGASSPRKSLYRIGCNDCAAELYGSFPSKEVAAIAWNRRAIDRRGGVVTDAMVDAGVKASKNGLTQLLPSYVRKLLEAALGQAQGGGT